MGLYRVLKTCKDKNSGELLKKGALVSCADTRRANAAVKGGYFKPMEVIELKTAAKAKSK
jgi:hypothetical protein